MSFLQNLSFKVIEKVLKTRVKLTKHFTIVENALGIARSPILMSTYFALFEYHPKIRFKNVLINSDTT